MNNHIAHKIKKACKKLKKAHGKAEAIYAAPDVVYELAKDEHYIAIAREKDKARGMIYGMKVYMASELAPGIACVGADGQERLFGVE